MSNISIKVDGLKEIKDYINPKRINKALALGVSEAVTQLHNSMRSAIKDRYALNRSLDSVLVSNQASSVKQGKGFILQGLEYKIKPIDLSKYPYTFYPGNINAGATRPGRVHVVEIVKGQKRIVHGKDHFGGFVPRKGSLADPGKLVRIVNKDLPSTPPGGLMLERKTDARHPVRVLYGPSLAQLAITVYKHNQKVKQTLDNLENIIIEKFI
jgi:hypothetical protein